MSHDGGDSWAEVAKPATEVWDVAIDPHRAGTTWVVGAEPPGSDGPEARLYSTDDDGLAWQPRDLPLADNEYIWAFALDPWQSGGMAVSTSMARVLLSNDDGATWTIAPQLRVAEIPRLRYDRTRAGRLFAATYDGLYALSDGAAP